MNKLANSLILTFLLALLIVFAFISQSPEVAPPNPNQSTEDKPAKVSLFQLPLERASERITKKHFGTKVSPTSSPVTPERFSGYHTGTDFEILAGEETTDVTVKTICAGKLRIKQTVNGYGGVAIQDCIVNNESVTVLYGHIRLSSVSAKIGDELAAGTTLAVLGTGYSTETSGERKHLHLSIHKGAATELKGYVPNQSQLTSWIDPETILGLAD